MQLSEFKAQHNHVTMRLNRISKRGNQVFIGEYIDDWYEFEAGGGEAWPMDFCLVVDPDSNEILNGTYEQGETYLF